MKESLMEKDFSGGFNLFKNVSKIILVLNFFCLFNHICSAETGKNVGGDILSVIAVTTARAKELVILSKDISLFSDSTWTGGKLVEEDSSGTLIAKSFIYSKAMSNDNLKLKVFIQRRNRNFSLLSQWENKELIIPVPKRLLGSEDSVIVLEFFEENLINRSIVRNRLLDYDEFQRIQRRRERAIEDANRRSKIKEALQAYSDSLKENAEKNKKTQIYQTYPGSSLRDYSKPGMVIENTDY